MCSTKIRQREGVRPGEVGGGGCQDDLENLRNVQAFLDLPDSTPLPHQQVPVHSIPTMVKTSYGLCFTYSVS